MPTSAVRSLSVTFPDSQLPDVPVDAELRFDSARPYAACLAFPVAPCGGSTGGHRVCWYFSRDLLNEGRHAPTGSGDVNVRPGSADDVLITLRTPSGRAELSAPGDTVTAFLADAFTLVPAGSESDHLDIDTAIARLRASG